MSAIIETLQTVMKKASSATLKVEEMSLSQFLLHIKPRLDDEVAHRFEPLPRQNVPRGNKWRGLEGYTLMGQVPVLLLARLPVGTLTANVNQVGPRIEKLLRIEFRKSHIPGA